jgi:hypothetical protein
LGLQYFQWPFRSDFVFVADPVISDKENSQKIGQSIHWPFPVIFIDFSCFWICALQ